MATSDNKKKAKNNGGATVLEMDKPEDSAPVAAETAPPAPEPNRGGRGNRKEGPNFFDRIKSIAAADWGTRYYVYLYRLEPLIDRLRSGERKYVMRYEKPVDEETILVEHGSGRYRLNLTCNKPIATDTASEIASHEFDLLNDKYPPRIPKGEWIDDPRNKKWAWAKEPEPPVIPPAPVPTSSPVETFVEAMKVTSDIRKEVRSEMQPASPAVPATDPMHTAMSFAKDLLSMRAENPMVEIMKEDMKALRAELSAEREANRKMMMDRLEKPGQGQNGIGMIDEFLSKAETLMPKLKGLLNVATEGATNVVHGRPRPWWQETLSQSLPQIAPAVGTVLQTLVTRFMAPPPGSVQFAPNPGMNGAPQNGSAQIAAQPNEIQAAGSRLMNFLMFNARPLQRYFEDFLAGKEIEGIKAGGDDFAAWVVESYGDGVLKDARMLGTGNIMALFKSSALWPHVQQHEVRMVDFLNQFIAFQPEPEEDDGTPENENVLDLTTQEAM